MAMEEGEILFVGEGNLSFSRALIEQSTPISQQIVTSTLEPNSKLTKEAQRNALICAELEATVLHGVDATKLSNHFLPNSFKSVIFQFPNVGSREPTYGRNPNHHLARSFFRSTKDILKPNGQVIVTTISSSHYDGAFSMFEAAKWAGFEQVEVYPFFPSDYPEYNHSNTLDPTDSAIENVDAFQTFIFHLKEN